MKIYIVTDKVNDISVHPVKDKQGNVESVTLKIKGQPEIKCGPYDYEEEIVMMQQVISNQNKQYELLKQKVGKTDGTT